MIWNAECSDTHHQWYLEPDQSDAESRAENETIWGD